MVGERFYAERTNILVNAFLFEMLEKNGLLPDFQYTVFACLFV